MRLLLLSAIMAVLCFSFDTQRKKKVNLPDIFEKIPAGSFIPGEDTARRFRVSEFYMSKYEVTNFQYRTFYREVEAALSPAEKESIACDTAGWTRLFPHGNRMKDTYYSQFNDHPVVNVSYAGAVKYCELLQQKIQRENPEYDIEVKLPSKEEWIWAARGGRRQAMFPWGNYYLRNKKGEPMCNFKIVQDQAIYRNRQTGKPAVAEPPAHIAVTRQFTTAVKSYYPNDYGLYNMCGNAAEMIEAKGTGMGGSWNDYGGDIHIRAESVYEKPAPTVGFRPVIMVRAKQ